MARVTWKAWCLALKAMERKSWLARGMAAVVTGGGSGIGEAIARRLTAEGVRVAALSRSAAGGGDGNTEPWPVACDVRDELSIQAAVDAAAGRFGRVDILVNAAGVSMPEFREISRIDPELWRRLVDTNMTGLFLMTRACMPLLSRSGGFILNILSTAAFRGMVGNAPYTASKYGARAVSETAALEGKEKGVRVSSISPGPVDTNIWSHKTVPPAAEKRELMLDPEDIADIALFLLKTPEYVVIDNMTVTPMHF